MIYIHKTILYSATERNNSEIIQLLMKNKKIDINLGSI